VNLRELERYVEQHSFPLLGNDLIYFNRSDAGRLIAIARAARNYVNLEMQTHAQVRGELFRDMAKALEGVTDDDDPQ
jgi:hypothetical protein